MSNLFWQKNKKTLAAIESPFKSEEELEQYLFNTRGLLQDISIISRQIRSRTSDGIKIPDMLGVDEQGNVVIIENKNVPVDEKIIGQVLTYAIWAESNPDSIKNIWLEKALEGTEPDWDNLQIRIIVVAPEIKRHLTKFVGKIGYPVDLVELKRFVIDDNEFILVSEIEAEGQQTARPAHTMQEWGFDFYRTEHNMKSVKDMERVVNDVEKYIKSLGFELEKKFNKHYVGFKYGFSNVCGVDWMGSKSFGLYFKVPKHAPSPKQVQGLEYREYSERWKQAQYKVESVDFDIEKLRSLFEAAYRNARGE